MLDILDRFGRSCFYFSLFTGIIILMLGFLVQLSTDGPAVWTIYYFFGPIFIVIGYLIKFILCHKRD